MAGRRIPRQQKTRTPRNPETTLSLKKYAEKYQYSLSGIREAIAKGRVRGYKLKGRWWLWDLPPGFFRFD
jgi:hypothetical protein